MCGVMTVGAVMGAGQALMGHIGKVQEADAANEALSQDYAHKVRTLEATHRDAVIAFQARDVDAQINWASNTLEFNRFIASEQLKINQLIAKAFQDAEKGAVKAFSTQDIAKSFQRSGVSARRVQTSQRAALGRDKAKGFADIDMATDKSMLAIKDSLDKKYSSDQKILQRIGQAPQRGPGPLKPKFHKGPSMLSLAFNVAAGVTTGRLAGYGAKNPAQIADMGGSFTWL